MSPVPARPSRPERCSSASDSSATADAPVLRQPQQQAGIDAAGPRGHDEPVERGEAHRRVDRAAAGHRGQRRAGAEVAGHDPQVRDVAAHAARPRAGPRTRARGRGSRTRSAARHSAGSAYVDAPGASVAWKAVSKQATAGAGMPASASIAASARGWCSGARSASAASRARTSSSIHTADRNSSPPCTTRCADRVHRPACRRAPRRGTRRPRPLERALADRRVLASSTRSFRLLEPALTTSSCTGVIPGQVQSRTSGRSSPCSRVYARCRSRSSTICWRSAAARVPSPGTRSITSMTRWKRSRSLSMTMSNGVVVVPSSL